MQPIAYNQMSYADQLKIAIDKGILADLIESQYILGMMLMYSDMSIRGLKGVASTLGLDFYHDRTKNALLRTLVYNYMNIEKLRAYAVNRNVVPPGNKFSKRELIKALADNDDLLLTGVARAAAKPATTIIPQIRRKPLQRIPVVGRRTTTTTTTTTVPIVPKPTIAVMPRPMTPTIPVMPTTTVPVMPTIPMTPTVPVMPTTTVPVIPRPMTPTVPVMSTTTVPVIPRPTRDIDAEGIEYRIRMKLEDASYDMYDATWRRTTTQKKINAHSRAKDLAEIITSTQYVYYIDKNGMKVVNGFMEYIMNSEPQLLAELATELGFNRLNDTVDTYCNLFWYINVSEGLVLDLFTRTEKSYISGLDVNGLLRLLGQNYRGPRDKASLIFAVISGRSAPRPEIKDIPRYQDVVKYSPENVWLLAEKLYNIIDIPNRFISPYPPYVHVALQPHNSIEQLVAIVNKDNVNVLAERFGILYPEVVENEDVSDKIKYYVSEVKNYEPILGRPTNLLPPPSLAGKNLDQITNILSQYTTKEIVSAYEPIGAWTDREDLIGVISIEMRGGSMWAWRHRYCNNDDTENVMSVEQHGDMDKDDPNNPTLSYGVTKNYRCYQVDELTAFFGPDPNADDDIFRFRVPDWRDDIDDPVTGQKLINEFPLESIKQLRELLRNPPRGYDVESLLIQVNEGIDAADNTKLKLRTLKTQYQKLPEDAKYLVRYYLAWIFVYGMWMRFWKGPGNEWPTAWIEGGGYAGRCEVGRRDQHVFIQQSVRTSIMESYEQIPGLKQWIENLPLVDYNFKTGDAKAAAGDVSTVLTILDKIQLGDFCLAHGSDLLLKTSYFLITYLLDYNNDEFNNFIREMLQPLKVLELQVVEYQLANIKDRTAALDRVVALEARREELLKLLPYQPDFIPKTVGKTGHIDPRLGRQIEFN